MRLVRRVARYLLALFFVGAGVNHFVTPDFYVGIMPDYIPAHGLMVSLSGVTEIVAGVMLVVPRLTRWGAWFIVAHLVVFFTVHVWMIQESERYVTGSVTLASLWIRILLQFVLMAWALWCVSDGPVRRAAP